MTTIRIALANLPFPATPDESLARVEQAIGEAAGQGAAVVCFPECFVPGYRALGAPVPAADPAFFERAHAAVAEAAGRSRIGLVLGTERFVGGALRISTLVVGPDGRPLGWQDKVQLDPSEEALYQPGTERHAFRDRQLRQRGLTDHLGGGEPGRHAALPPAPWCGRTAGRRPRSLPGYRAPGPTVPDVASRSLFGPGRPLRRAWRGAEQYVLRGQLLSRVITIRRGETPW